MHSLVRDRRGAATCPEPGDPGLALASENGEPALLTEHRLAPMETALPLDHTACERARLAPAPPKDQDKPAGA